MPGLSNAGRNVMLDGLGAVVDFVSLHTADPGATGTSEVAGGSPAYARKAVAWDAASGGSMASSGDITFDVPGSTTIRFLGYWSLASGGTFYGSRALDTDQTFPTQGTYTIASGAITETQA